jgi:hypothetical protein
MQVSRLDAFRPWPGKPPWFAFACVISLASPSFEIALCAYANCMHVSDVFAQRLVSEASTRALGLAWSCWQTCYADALMLQCSATTMSFGDMSKHLRLVCERAIEAVVVSLDCYISSLLRPEMRRYGTPTHSSVTKSQHRLQQQSTSATSTSATFDISRLTNETVSTKRYK